MRIDVYHFFTVEGSLEQRLSAIQLQTAQSLERIKQMSNDLSQLDAVINALKGKVDETNGTLAGLAQAVIDLKAQLAAGTDVQPAIDALVVRSQEILSSLTAAEDAADDQLPAATPPAGPV